MPAPGVPDSTPVVALSDTPVGSAPVSLKTGGGLPLAVTVKVPALPTVKVVVADEVMIGAVGRMDTVRVKLWVAFGRVPLDAVMVNGYDPPVPAAGVPESTPVVMSRVTPVGRVPVSA